MDLKLILNPQDESPQGPPPPPPPKKRTPLPNSPIKRPLFPCPYCHYVYSIADVLDRHIIDVHGTPCPICGMLLTQEEMRNHVHPEGSMTSAPPFSQDSSYVSPHSSQAPADVDEADREAALTLLQLSRQPPAMTPLEVAQAAAARKERRKVWDENQKKRVAEAKERKKAGFSEPEKRPKRPKATTPAEKAARKQEYRETARKRREAAKKEKEGENPPRPTVQCPICQTHFYEQEDLDEHMERAHPY